MGALAQAVMQGVQIWNSTHPASQRIDPQAELAVASQEGLGGGIGDQGTSFGPNQLHFGGAYPSFAPQTEQAAQQWAWSPAGINYALRRIASVAGGLQGAPAVTNIVDRFERPANPSNEVAGALRAYGLPAPSGGTIQSGVPAMTGGPSVSPSLAAAQPMVRPSLAAPLRAAFSLLGITPPSR